MRVVFDGRVINDRFPGIGRYAYRLLEALIQTGGEDLDLTVLYTPALPNRRWALETLASPRVRLVPLRAPPFSLAEHVVVPRAIPRDRAVLVHGLHYAMPLGLLAHPAPVILTLYDLTPLRVPEGWSPLQRGVYRLWHRIALRHARALMVVSEAARDDLRRAFGDPRGPIAVVPGAADPAFFPRPREAVRAVLARYALREPYLLYVGINKPSKNLGRLLEAWRAIRGGLAEGGRLPDLVLAGPIDPRYPLEADEGVRILGMVPEADLPALYTGARLAVLPSLWEGFGLPILEAMACGTPVACSDLPSLREVAGDLAAFFHPRDVADMARTLRSAWVRAGQDPNWRAAVQHHARRFSWGESARRALDLYRQVLTSGAAFRRRKGAGAAHPDEEGSDRAAGPG